MTDVCGFCLKATDANSTSKEKAKVYLIGCYTPNSEFRSEKEETSK